MLPAILFGFSFHEFCHAYVATRLGDSTPGDQGRLTLNPIHHIDPMGFLLMIFAHFGWAKPVQINPGAFKKPRRDDFLVSVAGPLSNFIAAIGFAILIKIIFVVAGSLFAGSSGDIIYQMATYFVWTNLILAFFNLLPIPPLDGSHLIFDLLPPRFAVFREKFYQIGSVLLIAIILIENQAKIDILPLGKVTAFFYRGIFDLFGIPY